MSLATDSAPSSTLQAELVREAYISIGSDPSLFQEAASYPSDGTERVFDLTFRDVVTGRFMQSLTLALASMLIRYGTVTCTLRARSETERRPLLRLVLSAPTGFVSYPWGGPSSQQAQNLSPT